MPDRLIQAQEDAALKAALCVLISDIADASDDLMDALWDFMEPGDRDLWFRAAAIGRATDRSKANRARPGSPPSMPEHDPPPDAPTSTYFDAPPTGRWKTIDAEANGSDR
jgi:hypothetical protein